MFFKRFPTLRKETTFLQTTIEVARHARGTRRYEARPVRMALGDKEVLFEVEDFVAYGRIRRSARRRCLRKVLSYLRKLAQAPDETGPA